MSDDTKIGDCHLAAGSVGTVLFSSADARSVLDRIVREGAQKMLQSAIEAEVDEFLVHYLDRRDAQGKRLVVRNGHLPSREIVTGAGKLDVSQPRVRDRSLETEDRVQFSSKILPPYLRRSKSIDELIPWLYLKGVSTGGFGEALQSLLGVDCQGLSANVVVRLKEQWTQEYETWSRRDLTARRYVYVWADGIHVNVRLEDDANKRQCILVLMGATADGHKELIAVSDGYRESEQSWCELLLSLKQRGLTEAPCVAIGDGALGFWAAIRKVFPTTKEQRCWVHKTANVLNKLPKSIQPRAKDAIHEIWMSDTREMPRNPSTISWRNTRPSTRRRASACEKTGTYSWRFMTTRPTTGSTYAPLIQSNPRLQPFAYVTAAPREVGPGKRV